MLQSMTLHRHIITTQSAEFTLQCTRSVVQPMGLDKCMVTFTHHYRIMQASFTTLKILRAPPSSPLPPPPWQPLILLLPT